MISNGCTYSVVIPQKTNERHALINYDKYFKYVLHIYLKIDSIKLSEVYAICGEACFS